MRVRNAVLTLGSLAALCAAGGCSATPTAGTGVVYAPDRVVPVASTNLNQVILNAQSADRLGIVTKPVRRLPGGGLSVVPVSSVLYDKNGGTWVYTNVAAFTYVRAAVVLGPIDNDMWELTSGPAPGTKVVTVGGAELLGAEQGVEGE